MEGDGELHGSDRQRASVRRRRFSLEAPCNDAVGVEGEAQRVLAGARIHPDIPQRCPHDPGGRTEPRAPRLESKTQRIHDRADNLAAAHQLDERKQGIRSLLLCRRQVLHTNREGAPGVGQSHGGGGAIQRTFQEDEQGDAEHGERSNSPHQAHPATQQHEQLFEVGPPVGTIGAPATAVVVGRERAG